MVTKTHLVDKISQEVPHLMIKDIALGVVHIIDRICDALAHQQRVEIRGFGAFSLRLRAARITHNPKTLEKFSTPQKYVVRFKPGKEMRTKIQAQQVHSAPEEET